MISCRYGCKQLQSPRTRSRVTFDVEAPCRGWICGSRGPLRPPIGDTAIGCVPPSIRAIEWHGSILQDRGSAATGGFYLPKLPSVNPAALVVRCLTSRSLMPSHACRKARPSLPSNPRFSVPRLKLPRKMSNGTVTGSCVTLLDRHVRRAT